ncbi:MAG: nuclear transport factor 2 family protein [Deltaproteobacteria bacterium]|nr:nuclear transport factor 2 family protein [Deltaproteobacteria bacterium]MBW2421749.1 nuclear transport factor 2 family protein [Deltaproteobacteria bacterium]
MPLTLHEISDRIEINDLLIRYTKAIDDKNWDLLDSVYTPDADIDYTTSGGIAGKYPEIREWLAKALAIFPATVHFIGNSEIELDGDHAMGRTFVYNPMAIPKEDGELDMFTVGAYYIDDLVRTDAGWRIAKRFEQQVYLQSGITQKITLGK